MHYRMAQTTNLARTGPLMAKAAYRVAVEQSCVQCLLRPSPGFQETRLVTDSDVTFERAAVASVASSDDQTVSGTRECCCGWGVKFWGARFLGETRNRILFRQDTAEAAHGPIRRRSLGSRCWLLRTVETPRRQRNRPRHQQTSDPNLQGRLDLW